MLRQFRKSGREHKVESKVLFPTSSRTRNGGGCISALVIVSGLLRRPKIPRFPLVLPAYVALVRLTQVVLAGQMYKSAFLLLDGDGKKPAKPPPIPAGSSVAIVSPASTRRMTSRFPRVRHCLAEINTARSVTSLREVASSSPAVLLAASRLDLVEKRPDRSRQRPADGLRPSMTPAVPESGVASKGFERLQVVHGSLPANTRGPAGTLAVPRGRSRATRALRNLLLERT